MLKAFAIVHRSADMRTDKVPRVVEVIYGEDLESSRDWAVHQASELSALNDGDFNVLGIMITDDEKPREDGETVFVRLVNVGGFWRFDMAAFLGTIGHEIGCVANVQTIPLTLLETNNDRA
jgi:hypothetical protein